jgi:hypothetical protein
LDAGPFAAGVQRTTNRMVHDLRLLAFGVTDEEPQMTALTAAEKVSAIDEFIPDPQLPDGAADPVFGPVQHGWIHGLWTIRNPALGTAQVTDGARVVTARGDGFLTSNTGFFRRKVSDRRVDLGGVRYTFHHTSWRRARLLRNGVPIGWLRRVHTGRYFHGGWTWTYEVTRWAEPADATAAAVGHLLASRFEVGAYGWVVNTFTLLTLPPRLLG